MKGNVMLKPLADRVVIKRIETESKTASGIVLPDAAKEKPEEGEVIEVGKDVKEVKKGDRVVFSKYSPTEFKKDSEELLIVKEEDILAIIA
jgi:chaperonin GroES